MPHARLHEVWQLVTNCSIGAVALWLAWSEKSIRLSSMLNITVMGGGRTRCTRIGGLLRSDILSGNVSKTILGLELAVFAASLVVVLAVAAFAMSNRRSQ